MTEIKLDKEMSKYFFPEKKNRGRLRITKESLYYTTLPSQAMMVNDILITLYKSRLKNKTILDMSSNIGGNIYSLAKLNVKKIIANEYDTNTYEILIHNCKIILSKKNFDKITFTNKDANDLGKEMKESDIWFIDPPWGGPGYKKYKKLELYYGDTNIIKFISKSTFDTAIIKVPKNYNFFSVKKILNIKNKQGHKYKYYRAPIKINNKILYFYIVITKSDQSINIDKLMSGRIFKHYSYRSRKK